jgi:hypothetical protein
MAEKKDHLFILPIGASSLLSAFAVLCLVVFALLALSTVRADERLSEASLQATKDYYAADCKAQEILARIRLGESLPEGVEAQAQGGYVILRYAVPISDVQELRVEVGQRADRSCEILRWQAVANEEWVGDDGLKLWGGTSE